ncbi:MAG: response regulator transcription factor [Anaerolineae bacterium]
MKERILVVEDDQSLAKVIGISLEKEGYDVLLAGNGTDGLKAAYESHPSLVILDIMMPRLDGWEVCRRLKEMAATPVLMLTARVTEADVLKGFEAGADDYLRKPFSLAELNARVKALSRGARLARRHSDPSVLRSGDLELDLPNHRTTLRGESIALTPTEFRLLAYMMQNQGRLLTHEDLLAQVWGDEFSGEHQYLRLYVRYLRRKLRDDATSPLYITSVRGQGYRFR